MVQYPTELVAEIDRLLDLGELSLNENERSVRLKVEDVAAAERLRALILGLGWDVELEDESSPLDLSEPLDRAFPPVSFELTKPAVDPSAVLLLHPSSLGNILDRRAGPPAVIMVGDDPKSIETYSTLIARWSSAAPDFSNQNLGTRPTNVVRDLSGQNVLPPSLDPWLLRDKTRFALEGAVAEHWARQALPRYLRSICSEIEPGISLVFKGQPTVRVSDPGNRMPGLVAADAFSDLYELVEWIYKKPEEAETKHALAVAEIVRSGHNVLNAEQLVRECLKGGLQGARHAYLLGLDKLSRESLQALSDLRKSIVDETTKLAEASRQLTLSIAGAVFVAVSVIGARLTLAKDSHAFSIIAMSVGCVLFLYLIGVVASGWQFIRIQRGLREAWKDRSYKYLSPNEYRSLIASPAEDAERVYKYTTYAALIIGLGLLAVIGSASFPEATSKWIARAKTGILSWSSELDPALEPSGQSRLDSEDLETKGVSGAADSDPLTVERGAASAADASATSAKPEDVVPPKGLVTDDGADGEVK